MRYKNWEMTNPRRVVAGLPLVAFALASLSVGFIVNSTLVSLAAGFLFPIELIMAGIAMAMGFEQIDPNKGKFCASCGDKYSPKTTQTGYDGKTGARRTETHFTCLNSTCKSQARKSLNPTGLYVGNGTITGTTSGPQLNKLFSTFASSGPAAWTFTTCHAPRVMTCGSCLDALVADGTLTEEEANLLR